MPLAERLRSFLDARRIPYSLTYHRPVLRASELASVEHLPAWEVAKTIVVYGDNKYHMLVLPADRHVDMSEVESALHLRHVRMAREPELSALFPDCELGAMPALGILYDLPVYLDSSLANEAMITFNAGNHEECVHMRMADFVRVTKPTVVSLAALEYV
jgi:Ala-tRNA(Pro) deacylase